MTPEGKVKAAVKKVLLERGAYFFMPVQMGYGKRTVDFLVCLDGRFIAIETKRKTEKARTFQEEILKEIRAAGGLTFVIDSVDDANTLSF